ncbi:MAG: Crp/Fnr family transcriptional regulator [Flavobacteriaceae bacterium]|nr:Crp/Fnr family transcriptional regulator [Flavobacteriaceae bacterium]
MISQTLLERYGAVKIQLDPKEILFDNGNQARYYFQVISGKVKMNNFNSEGKEFIQGMFTSGMGFGEPPLLVDLNYPAGCEAMEKSCLWRLSSERFFKLLQENPDAHLELTKSLAHRLHYKATMAAEISSENAGHRILRLIDYLKEHVHHKSKEEVFIVDLSRQQLADLTGLRVETVIRTVKALEHQGELRLKAHKIMR